MNDYMNTPKGRSRSKIPSVETILNIANSYGSIMKELKGLQELKHGIIKVLGFEGKKDSPSSSIFDLLPLENSRILELLKELVKSDSHTHLGKIVAHY